MERLFSSSVILPFKGTPVFLTFMKMHFLTDFHVLTKNHSVSDHFWIDLLLFTIFTTYRVVTGGGAIP